METENEKMEPRMDTKEREETLKALKERLELLEKTARQLSAFSEQAEAVSSVAKAAACNLALFVCAMKGKLAKMERGVGDGER